MGDVRYNVSSAPHVRQSMTTNQIMGCVLIAMIPAAVFGIFNFGIRALAVIAVTMATCVITEWIYDKIAHKKNTITDLSACVTGMILALNFPSEIPFFICIIGGVFAIVVVKMIFGGLGQNFMNPALAARCFLLLSFTGYMNDFECDAYTGATPLAQINAGEQISLLKAFLGTTSGTIGETSVLCLLIGAVFLLVMGIIKIRIPGTFILTFAIMEALFGGHLGTGDLGYFVLAEVMSGGLIFGAFFMATDYVTSPITPKGQIIYGIILGVLLGVFRIFGASAEGCSYAIIFGNMLVPLIERFTIPVAFGKGGEKNGKKQRA